MAKAFGIVNSSGRHISVEGLESYRPIGAFSFLGRYRVIDFPISNFSNSEIESIQVYVKKKPRSLTEHIGTGRHYNINSKRGKIQIMFSEHSQGNAMYDTDIASFYDNIESIEKMREPYVIIAPSYMVFAQDFDALLKTHIESGADISLLYHSVDNAKESFLNCDTLNLNKQKGVLSIARNSGTAKNKDIFMDTYVMSKELFIDLIKRAKALSSMYSLVQIINELAEELDIRAVPHRGYFSSITDFNSYYAANMDLIDGKNASKLFSTDWPIYTRTNDSCPTQYCETADVKASVISNGCMIEGEIYNSVVGRGCKIMKGSVIKNCIILPDVVIGKDVHIENMIVDKHSKVTRVKEILAPEDKPGYVSRGDTI